MSCAKSQIMMAGNCGRTSVVESRVQSGLDKEAKTKGAPIGKRPSMPKIPKDK